MNNTQRGLTAFVLVIAGLAGSVIGQDARIDRRYSPGQRAQGRLLDASLEYGSGGINTAVPTNYVNTHISSLSDSRGLSSFSGHVPSLSRSLRVRDITSGVNTFRQQSLGGAYSPRSGNLYRPQDTQYDNPLTRTLHTRDIVRAESTGRLALPQNVARNNKIANKLYVDATADYKSFVPTDMRVTGHELGLGSDPRHSLQNQLVRKFESHDIARRGGDELFGVLRQEDRAKLARELSEFQDEDTTEADQQAIDARVDAGVGEPLEAESGKELVERLRRPGETEDDGDSREKSRQRQDRMSRSAPDIPGENQDVFFDLLLKIQEQKRQEREDEAAAKEEDKRKDSTRIEVPSSTRESSDDKSSSVEAALPYRVRQESRLEPSEQFVEVDTKKHLIIHNLAGTSKDLFNRYMNRAKKDLLAGRSYQAARSYELATMVRPKNPLAYLGGFLSTFAAGEWFTASRKLRTAVELFPPLMETRLDIPKLMPAKTFRAKLPALETWIATVDKDDVPLLFMAAFLQHNNGNDAGAKRHAREILELEKSDRKLIEEYKKKASYKILLQRHEDRYRIPNAYAEYLLGGKSPAEQSIKPKDSPKAPKALKAK